MARATAVMANMSRQLGSLGDRLQSDINQAIGALGDRLQAASRPSVTAVAQGNDELTGADTNIGAAHRVGPGGVEEAERLDSPT